MGFYIRAHFHDNIDFLLKRNLNYFQAAKLKKAFVLTCDSYSILEIQRIFNDKLIHLFISNMTATKINPITTA